MIRLPVAVGLALLLLLAAPTGASTSPAGRHLPQVGDQFRYTETILLTNGQGNYTGYTEQGHYNGSIAITAVQPNGTVNATYESAGTYANSLGQSYPWSESGSFSFSALTFHYVRGTDNQTGYVNPYVWFYMDNTLPVGSSFYLLNSQLTVVSTSAAVASPLSPTGYVQAIEGNGSGSYPRNDVYGQFTASYTWRAYFDPGSGYVLGYVYTEVDQNAAGDGFTWTDTLTDTQATGFSPSPAPAPSSSSPSAPFPWTLVVLAVVAVVVVIVVVALLVARRHRGGARIPQHPTAPLPRTMPTYGAPPPVRLIPGDQPAVQQVVIRETVKVPCQYCGTLIDSTATTCPRCGATRT
jgi:hypothetical protein